MERAALVVGASASVEEEMALVADVLPVVRAAAEEEAVAVVEVAQVGMRVVVAAAVAVG